MWLMQSQSECVLILCGFECKDKVNLSLTIPFTSSSSFIWSTISDWCIVYVFSLWYLSMCHFRCEVLAAPCYLSQLCVTECWCQRDTSVGVLMVHRRCYLSACFLTLCFFSFEDVVELSVHSSHLKGRSPFVCLLVLFQLWRLNKCLAAVWTLVRLVPSVSHHMLM